MAAGGRAGGAAPRPRLGAGDGDSPRAAAPAPTGSRLIGRDALLGQVRAQLDEGRSVLLHGEAGIGKTSLLRQLHRDVPDAVLVSAAAAGTPYSLLHDLLDVHAGARDDPDWADFRSRRRAPDETGDLHLLAEDLADRYLVGSAVLMVDDAETVDLLSLQLLRRLVGRGTQLVVARRPGRRLLREWSALAPVELQVGPLSDDETRQLVARIRPGAVLDDDQLAAIGGVPLLAEHAVSTELGLDAVGERLLAPLGEDARAGARTLAVVQTPVPVAALSSLVGTEAVEELLVSRVLEVHGDRIRFLHPRLEEGLRRSLGYVGCTAVLRDVLESGWDAPALVVADAVEELEPALPSALVARWALAAGQESLLGGDLDGAARHLERAAADDDPARARQARTLLARSLVAAGRIVDARLLLMPLMDELRAEGLDEELARCIDDYIGMLRLDGGEMHVVERHTRWLLGRDRLAPDRRVAVLDALTRSVDVAQLAARTEELLAECERAGSPYSQFCALEAQWRLSHYRGEEPTRRARFAMQALDLAAQLADTELEVRMTRHLLDDLVALGWGEELAARLARLEEISRTRRHAQARWWVQLMSVDTLLRRGKAEDALLAAREAHDAWPRVPEQLRVELLQLQSLVILFVLGDWEQLAAALHEVTDGPDSLWIPDLVPATALLLCRVVAGQAGPDEVATGLDRVVAAPAGWRRVAELALAGRAAVAAGVPAPRLREALEPYGKCWVTFGPAVCSLGPVATVLSGLATLDGDTGSAKYWAAHARMRCTSMDASWWLSEVPDT
ncbi:AAA family ATPase [Nocardioides euryhalodurans]|uniref:ATP-binding protein n=1 Tax=Nocardioides euryhalodurans TaxID=2518370 RepID=A0A4P7GLR0_9ACTN|nr:ATP-binding protein [Nocardioides euryhalodurans]QBR92764.1 ATP-binding protein [Nocardioides euryhalodurans]